MSQDVHISIVQRNNIRGNSVSVEIRILQFDLRRIDVINDGIDH